MANGRRPVAWSEARTPWLRMTFPIQRSRTDAPEAALGSVTRYSMGSPIGISASDVKSTPQELMLRVSPDRETGSLPVRTSSTGNWISNLLVLRCSLTTSTD